MSFGQKITMAVRALKAEGKLPRHLRAGERDKRIFDRLVDLGL